MNRREFVMGSLAASQVRAAAPPVAPPARVALVCDPRRPAPDIARLFATIGLGCTNITPVDAEQMDAQPYDLLWIECVEYPYATRLNAAMRRTVERFLGAGKGVFAEFAVNFPGVPAKGDVQKTGVARLYVAEALKTGPEPVGAGTILDEHDSVCVTLEPRAAGAVETLRFAKVRGVGKVIGTPSESWPGLVCGTDGKGGRFAVAATSLSEYRRRQYAPVARWEQFLTELSLWLLPEAARTRALAAYVPCRAYTEPRAWVTPGSSYKLVVESTDGSKLKFRAPLKESSKGRFEVGLQAQKPGVVKLTGTAGSRPFSVDVEVLDRKEAYRRALQRNIEWFEKSGVMPRADGSLGVTEWISAPDTEGNRIPYGKGQMFAPDRADCVFESALAMWMYGQAAESQRHRDIGLRMMRRVMDFQRIERGDRYFGLWYTRGRSGPIYQDDNAMAILCSMAAYRWMRHPLFLERGMMAARASLEIFAGAPPQSAGSADAASDHPHERGQMLAAWLYTSGLTGDPRYAEKALPLVRKMAEEYPKIPRLLISRTGESAKFLLPLALAWQQSRDPFFRTALSEQADYLRSRMAPCGAIQEDGSNTGDRVAGDRPGPDLRQHRNHHGPTVHDELRGDESLDRVQGDWGRTLSRGLPSSGGLPGADPDSRHRGSDVGWRLDARFRLLVVGILRVKRGPIVDGVHARDRVDERDH